MKSKLNFKVKKDGQEYDMHDLGVWVSSFHIYSPNITRSKTNVPGMPGAHLRDTQDGERTVYIAMQIEADNMNEFDELKHRIFELFYSKDEINIIRDLTPDKEIRVLQEGSYDINNLSLEDGEYELFLTMIDPFIYGKEVNKPLNTETGTIINVEGTAETKPIFELDVTAPITYAMVMNHLNEYMMIGQPIDVESQVPFQKYERVLYGDGKSLVGWSPHDSVDGGSVAGTMETNGTRFQAASYGTGTSWHGPAIKRGLVEPLKDFRLETTIGFWNGQPQQVGRVEIYLLDVLGNQVGKLAMKDTQIGMSMSWGEIRAGDNVSNHFMINGPASRNDGWNDFYGMLRLEREGKMWKAYIGKINQTTGEHNWRMAAEWPDNEGLFTRTVAQVVIHVARMGTHTSGAMGIYNVSLYKINQQADGVPYIADVGDKIIFDFQKRELLVNGENRKDLKTDLGGRYFTYKPGENTIALSPNVITGISKHRPAYK